MLGYLSSMDHITFFTTKKIHRSRWASFNWVSKEIRNCFDFASLNYWSKTLTPSPQPVGCKSKTIAGVLPRFTQFSYFIAELAEHSPIIIQNSSNPSSRKNLDVRPYKVLLLTCVVNCTAGTLTPRLCSVVQWSVHWAPSRTTRVLALAGARRWDVREKKCELRF